MLNELTRPETVVFLSYLICITMPMIIGPVLLVGALKGPRIDWFHMSWVIVLFILWAPLFIMAPTLLPQLRAMIP